MVWVTAGILGIILACGAAYYLTAALVVKSNDAGNSKGTFWNFSDRNITLLARQDNVKQKVYEGLIRTNEAAGFHGKRWMEGK